tara:strand:- start:964 stop:2661 length:1698 start_codon:yes stop_codon:yes gene_type:complete
MYVPNRRPYVVPKNHDDTKLLAHVAGLFELCSSRADASLTFEGPVGDALAKKVKCTPFYDPCCEVPGWLLARDPKLDAYDDRVQAAAAERFCQTLQKWESRGTGAMAILSRTHRWLPYNEGISSRYDAVYFGVFAPVLLLCHRRLKSMLRVGSDLDNPETQRHALEFLHKTLVVMDETRLRDSRFREECATEAMCYRRDFLLDDTNDTNDDPTVLAKRVRFWFDGRHPRLPNSRMQEYRDTDKLVFEFVGPFSRAISSVLKHDPTFLLRMHALAPVDLTAPPKVRPWGPFSYKSSVDLGIMTSPELLLAWRLVAGHELTRSCTSSSDVCTNSNTLLDAMMARLGECSHIRHLFYNDNDDLTSAMMTVVVSLSAFAVHIVSGAEQTYDLKRATGQVPQPHLQGAVPRDEDQDGAPVPGPTTDDEESVAIHRLASLLAAVPKAADLVVNHTGRDALTIPGSIVSATAVLVVGTRKDTTTNKRKHASSLADTGQRQQLKHNTVPDAVERLARAQLDRVCKLQTPPSSTNGWRLVLRKYVVDRLAVKIRHLRATATEIADAVDHSCVSF